MSIDKTLKYRRPDRPDPIVAHTYAENLDTKDEESSTKPPATCLSNASEDAKFMNAA